MAGHNRGSYKVGDERLITREGTIIPIVARFGDGSMLLTYHTGADAPFSPTAAMRSDDGGLNWRHTESPSYRVCACGEIGADRALFFDANLWRVGGDEFVLLCNETTDGGRTFTGLREAPVHIPGVISKTYRPFPRDDPNYCLRPEIPEFYSDLVERHGCHIGGYISGRVLRLGDGALGLSCYAYMEGNMRRRDNYQQGTGVYAELRKKDEEDECAQGKSPDAGVAAEATVDMLTSSLLLRSEDDGRSWQYASTIGKIEPGKPWDGGLIYSEGFNETGLACTADGDLLALMRHGSYHLIWSNRSSDHGRTWQGIEPLNHPGVFPHVVPLENGVLAAAWGRPGMTVAFSLDGTGRCWDVCLQLMRDDEPSQKYPWLVPAGPNRVLVFYDRRKWDEDRRRHYDHGIYCREITIELD